MMVEPVKWGRIRITGASAAVGSVIGSDPISSHFGNSDPTPFHRKPASSLLDRQQAFGYTQEDIKFLLGPMAQNGEEGIGSMGNDSPLAVLSDKTSRCTTTLSSCLRR